jgi:MFS family permease
MPDPTPPLSPQRDRRVRRWLFAAIVVGALVRLPGVAWGVNWPDGFGMHHPDERTHVRNTEAIVRWQDGATGYPKAMGAYAAVPFLAWYALHGQIGGPRPHVPWTMGAGRLISVAFGLVAILLVFAICRDVLHDRRAGFAAAWLLALGGLHVTQSHFFVADVAAVTWTLAAVWLLWRDLTMSDDGDHESLRWAAFATGAALAVKFFFFVAPALTYAVFARAPRRLRAVHAGIFLFAGAWLSGLAFDTPVTFLAALTGGVNYPFQFDRVRAAIIYAVQLPGIFSLPLLLLAAAGTWSLAARLRTARTPVRRHALVVFGSVPLIALVVVLAKLDPFPRHWVIFTPFAAIAGGWALARLAERLRRAGRAPALVFVPVFIWMLAFVVDGERFFIFEPRNDALRWLHAHVPRDRSVFWMWHGTPSGYRVAAPWPGSGGYPDVLVVEMFDANNYLSGIGWRNSYPSEPREIFDGQSVERVAAMQSLFRGTSGCTEAVRFADSYVMPEYRLAMNLVGDRARSYITEVVVFDCRGQR